MREWIPVPGSVKARLVDAALERFEELGFEAANVVDIAKEAGTTTGALYHHFGSKQGLFDLVRLEMERRVRDRMEGAHAAVGGREGVVAALLVGFDAALRFKAARILSETAVPGPGLLEETLAGLVGGDAPSAVAEVLLGAWRAALRAAADGAPADAARAALAWTMRGG